MSPRDSTSTSTSSRSLKRKVRDGEEDENDHPSAVIDHTRSDAADDDGSSFEDERRKSKAAHKKKQKREKEKKKKAPKFPAWKDLKRTKKKGPHPDLGLFPVEVLDQFVPFRFFFFSESRER